MSGSAEFALSNLMAKSLAGREWVVGGRALRFQAYDPKRPGVPPWKSGAEGKAFPLLGPDGKAAAYLKFYNRTSKLRFDRTIWLASAQVHRWGPGLAAAPRDWADTWTHGRPSGVDFDFAAALSDAVPGRTWLELKYAIVEGRVAFSDAERIACVGDLLAALSALEDGGVVHGDLSPNNIVVDLEGPTLRLIDFDAFAVPSLDAPAGRLATTDGGSFGTEGYAPPDLARRFEAEDRVDTIVPYSDRHARDALLIELLGFGRSEEVEADDPGSTWPPAERRRALASVPGFPPFHLDDPKLFQRPETERPTSRAMAETLGRAPERSARPALVDLGREFRSPSPPAPRPILEADDPFAPFNPARPFPAPPGMPYPVFHNPIPPPPQPPPRPPLTNRQKVMRRVVRPLVILLLLLACWRSLAWYNRLGSAREMTHGDGSSPRMPLGMAIERTDSWAATVDGSETLLLWGGRYGALGVRNVLGVPKGRRLLCVDVASKSGTIVTGSADGRVQVWNLNQKPLPLADFPVEGAEGRSIAQVEVDGEGKRAMLQFDDGKTAACVELNPPRTLFLKPFEARVRAVAISYKGDTCVVAGRNLLVFLDAVTGAPTPTSPVRADLAGRDTFDMDLDVMGNLWTLESPRSSFSSPDPAERPRDGLLQHWSLDRFGRILDSAGKPTGRYESIVCSDGSAAIILRRGRFIEIYRPAKSSTSRDYLLDDVPPNAPLAISPDGRCLMFFGEGKLYRDGLW